MTATTPTRSRARVTTTQLWRLPVALWIGFVAVHVWVSWLGMFGPGYPLGDISGVYTFWAGHAYAGDFIVGVTTPWVYPIVAIVPILVSGVFGMDNYVAVFLGLVALVDAIVFWCVIGRQRDARRAVAAWWWLALLVCLGPVSLGRIDAIATPLALLGLLIVFRYPRVAGALLALAAWVKVWPAALAGAAFIALRARKAILVGALVASGGVAAIALVLGAGINLLSFITQQTSRGLQIESPAATAYLWQASWGVPQVGVYYDDQILTYQISAPGVEIVGALTSVLMALVSVGLVALGVYATRRGADSSTVLFALALAFTVELIVFNKVGSPQFMGWLAAPLAAGLAHGVREFRIPAVIALVMAALTQAIYPYGYDGLLRVEPVMLWLISIRNLLEFVLLALAVRMLWRVAMSPDLEAHVEQAPDVSSDKI